MAGKPPDPSDHWGLRERFLDFLPEWERSFGENVMRYFNYWREAEGGGITHYAAARRLIDYMSEDWGSWSRVMLEAITYEDSDSNRTRYVNFSKFITIVIKHWVENLNRPHLLPHPGIPVESVMASMPPPPLDQHMPLVYSPPPSHPLPHAPYHTPPNSPEIPYAMYWDAFYATYWRHDPPPSFPSVPPTAPQPPVVPSPSQPQR